MTLHRRGARGGRQAGGAPPARLPAARQRHRLHRRGRRGHAAAAGAATPIGAADDASRTSSTVDAADIERGRGAHGAHSRARRRRRPIASGCGRSKSRSSASSSASTRRCTWSRRPSSGRAPGSASPSGPAGCFLFTGPTGVGKTELAKQLALLLGNEFIRFDMSEYMEKHAVARLIGAPPGYVGFEQGGLLVDAVRTHPYSVVLLDEIEKAHPDIYNILLQVMDHATLTDNTGRKADFRNVVLILTSNAGSREMSAAAIGFCGVGDVRARRRRAAGARGRQVEGGHRAGLQPGVPQPPRRDRDVPAAVARRHGCIGGDHYVRKYSHVISVVSRMSTVYTLETLDEALVRPGPDFGVKSMTERNEMMSRWIDSNSVFDFEDTSARVPTQAGTSTDTPAIDSESESDSEIENEMIMALFVTGKRQKEQGELEVAVRFFKNCLSRLPSDPDYTSQCDTSADIVSKRSSRASC